MPPLWRVLERHLEFICVREQIRQRRNEPWETRMSVLVADELPSAFEGVVKPGFWHRLARALDASFANRSKRAMPIEALRRSRRDIERCRRLLRRDVRVPVRSNSAAVAPAGSHR
jgi:hypothetical protein